MESEPTKKQLKAEYDRLYRLKNKELLKKKKHEYFKRTYDPEKQREYNQARMKNHVEYCRKPEYRAKKHEYDVMRTAKKNYGEYAEAFLLTEQIFNLIPNREIKYEQGLTNKSQNRKRQWKLLMQNH